MSKVKAQDQPGTAIQRSDDSNSKRDQSRSWSSGSGDDPSASIDASSGTDNAVDRRRALRIGAAGIVAAGALALGGGRSEVARAADGDALLLGKTDNIASSDTKLVIDNSAPNSPPVDGLRVEVSRGYSAIYGIAGSGTYGAVSAKNTDGGPGMETTSKDGPGIIASGGGDSSGVYATSDTGPGVQGVGNSTGPGVLAKNTSGGLALEVNGPSNLNGAANFSGGEVKFTDGVQFSGNSTKFSGPVTFEGGSTKFTSPVEFQSGVQLGSLAGNAVIQRGKVSVTITNPAITSQSVILLTPVGNPSAALGGLGALLSASVWYERKPGQGFIIRLSLPAKQDLEFSYFIAKL